MNTTGNQTCSTCKCSKPVCHFGLIGGRRRRVCVQCINTTNTKSQVYQRPKSGTKYCIGCNEVYDISNFQSDPKDSTGLNTYCYNCKPHLLSTVFSTNSNLNKKQTFFSQLFNAFSFKQCIKQESETAENEHSNAFPNRNPMKKQNTSYVILKLFYGFN